VSNRDEYVEKMKRKLDQWNAEIDSLEEKTAAARSDVKEKYRAQLQALRGKRDDARARLAQVEAASLDSWEALKEGTGRSWDELRSALQETKDSFAAGLAEERAVQKS
jgi:hypothetical protein